MVKTAAETFRLPRIMVMLSNGKCSESSTQHDEQASIFL